MKKHYVVMMTNGFYVAENKLDAMTKLENHDEAMYVIYTQSQRGNYYHNRIKKIAVK